METWMITLNRVDTFNKYKQKFLDEGIQLKIFEGINGKNVSLNEKKNYTTYFWSIFGPDSAIGCAMSHIKLWEQLVKSNKDYYLILEDDVIFDEISLKSKIDSSIKNNPDFDIIYLGCLGSNKNNYKKFNKLLYFLQFGEKENIALATHSYIISKKGAKKLIKELKGKIYNHIDYCIQKMRKKNFKKVIVDPLIFFQTSTDSNYQSISSNSTTKFPIILNNILSKIYIDQNVSCDYVFTLSLCKIYGYNLTLISIFLFVIGMILKLTKMNLQFITIVYIILILPDLESLDCQIVINYLFLLFGYLLV